MPTMPVCMTLATGGKYRGHKIPPVQLFVLKMCEQIIPSGWLIYIQYFSLISSALVRSEDMSFQNNRLPRGLIAAF